jgi:hypothetical protein
MPMHDWTRVSAGTYHDFHCRWLADLTNRLNDGLLPSDHYAQVEQSMEGMTADSLILRADPPPHVEEEGGAVAVAQPRVRFTASLEADIYAKLARHITIRHSSDDRMIALIEVVSPGNKSGQYAFRTFLEQGIHLLLIDPFPPTPRDPDGLHAALWGELGGEFTPPNDKPLTLAAYETGPRKTYYVEPIAVGDTLTTMPLFLAPGRHVPMPLEESYTATYRGVARRWRAVLDAPPPATES